MMICQRINKFVLFLAILYPAALLAQAPCTADLNYNVNRGSQICNGNLQVPIPMVNKSIGFSLIYNSINKAQDSIFGRGFGLSIDHRIKSNVDGTYTFISGGGYKITFVWNANRARFEPDDKKLSTSVFTLSNNEIVQKTPGLDTIRYQTYGGDYLIKSITTARGHVITFSRAVADGKLLSIDGLFNQSILFSYVGNLVAYITETINGSITTKYHLTYHNNFLEVVGLGLEDPEAPIKHWKMVYHPTTGRMASIYSPDGTFSNFYYNAQGYLSKIGDRTGTIAEITYDASTVTFKSAYDYLKEEFDTSGSLIKSTDNYLITNFTYSNGQMVEKENHLHQKTQFEYNGPHSSLPTRITNPDGSWTQVTHDNDWWRILQTQVGKGASAVSTTDMSYDANGFLVQKTTDGVSTTYTVDAYGNTTNSTTPSGTSTYTYDNYDRLLSVTNFVGFTKTFTYNGARIASKTDHFGRTTNFTYDNRGYLSSVAYPDGRTKTFAFNYYGLLDEAVTKDTLGNQVDKSTFAREYHPDGRNLRKTRNYYGPLGLVLRTAYSFEHSIKEEFLTGVSLHNGTLTIDQAIDEDRNPLVQPNPIPAVVN